MSNDSVDNNMHDQTNTKRPRNFYTTSQQTTLCLMKRCFVFKTAADAAKVFNKVHADELSEVYGANGIAPNAVNNQLYEVEQGRGAYIKCPEIFTSSLNDVREKYLRQWAAITGAAIDLGILPKPRGQPSAAWKTQHKSLRRQIRVSSTSLDSDSDSDSDFADEYSTPPKVKRKESASDVASDPVREGRLFNPVISILPQPTKLRTNNAYWQRIAEGHRAPLVRSRDGYIRHKRPVLLFRHWTQSSGLRARLQLPGLPLHDKLKTHAKAHLDVAMTPSPFVSTSQFLLPVVQMAIASYQRDPSSTITVMDYDKLVSAIAKKYNGEGVHLTPVLCDRLGIKGQEYYRGVGEFFVFGEIPTEAIICSFKTSELLGNEKKDTKLSEILQLDTMFSLQNVNGLAGRLEGRAAPMNYETGMVLGEFLNRIAVPDEWKETLGAKLATTFRFQGYKNRRSSAYVDYMAGLFSIARDVRESTVISEAHLTDDESDFRDEIEDAAEQGVEDDGRAVDEYDSGDDMEIDQDQELLDQQLAATEAQFGDTAPDELFRESPATPAHMADDLVEVTPFSSQLLEKAEHATPSSPTAAPLPYSRPNAKWVIIDLTDGEGDTNGLGSSQGSLTTKKSEVEKVVDGDDVVFLESNGKDRGLSILSIRTKSPSD